MLRRGLIGAVAALGAAAAIAVPATPAAAIPPGNNLIVFAYFSDVAKTHLIGQSWTGCGQPAGSWGTTSGIRTLYFTPC